MDQEWLEQLRIDKLKIMKESSSSVQRLEKRRGSEEVFKRLTQPS